MFPRGGLPLRLLDDRLSSVSFGEVGRLGVAVSELDSCIESNNENLEINASKQLATWYVTTWKQCLRSNCLLISKESRLFEYKKILRIYLRSIARHLTELSRQFSADTNNIVGDNMPVKFFVVLRFFPSTRVRLNDRQGPALDIIKKTIAGRLDQKYGRWSVNPPQNAWRHPHARPYPQGRCHFIQWYKLWELSINCENHENHKTFLLHQLLRLSWLKHNFWMRIIEKKWIITNWWSESNIKPKSKQSHI